VVQAEKDAERGQTPSPSSWVGQMEAWYRWTGWIPGLFFLALCPTAPNLWLRLALGLFGACQVGHWVIERGESAWGRKLLTARYVEAGLSFVALPLLGILGLVWWAWDGFPGWRYTQADGEAAMFSRDAERSAPLRVAAKRRNPIGDGIAAHPRDARVVGVSKAPRTSRGSRRDRPESTPTPAPTPLIFTARQRVP
jgi:hypothetical protein